MSAADEAWQEWLTTPTGDVADGYLHGAFMAGYRRALEDAADDYPDRSDYPVEWLRARAAAVAPRETKD